MAMKPSERDYAKYMEKIAEWRSLGFDVEGLEDLLENDFEQFKKRKLEMLRGQISDSPEDKRSYRSEKEEGFESAEDAEVTPSPERRAPSPESSDVDDVEPIEVVEEVKPRRFERVPDDEDDITLVGKPLPVEAPPPDDEDTILIGDDEEPEAPVGEPEAGSREPGVTPEKKAAGVREIGEEPKAAERRPAKKTIPSEKTMSEERSAKEDFDDDDDAPMSMLGAEVPAKKRERGKEVKTKGRRDAGRKKKQSSQANKIIAVVIVGILIMTVLWYLMYTQDGGDNGNGNGNGGSTDLEAAIELDKESGIAGETFEFNADSSSGDIASYQWIFDTDFRKTSGFYNSVFVKGFFAPSIEGQKKYTVSLTVEASSGQTDTDTVTITIDQLEVVVTEEKIGDSAKYRVEGDITILNTDGIASFTQESGELGIGTVEVSIDEIILAYKNTTEEPMTSDLITTADTEDGFMNDHEVFLRHIQQDLDITGSMHATISSAITNYEENLVITGSMATDEKSYTDLSTDHTIKIITENDLQLDSSIQNPTYIPIKMDSKDTLTSYPDLRQVPTRIRLTDLSDEPIGPDDEDTVIYGSVAYSWHVISADQVLGTPALKLEFFVDSATLEANNIDKFDMYLWIGHNKPVALKTEMHAEFQVDGNDVIVNYQNRLVEYVAGSTALSSQSCSLDFSSSSHYAERYSDFDDNLKTEFAGNWSYLPELKNSALDNSFESFSPDSVMANDILPLAGVADYLANNPTAFVTSGYINRTAGELLWNITFGEKGDDVGYNVIVSDTTGVLVEHAWKINEPLNSSSDFQPVLTFAGSEYVFKDLNDADINANIFKDGYINFDLVSYGITSSLSYPTVDFTSISNFQTQKYSYYAQAKDGSFVAAIDAETGQLLFKLKHEYSGIDVPY